MCIEVAVNDGTRTLLGLGMPLVAPDGGDLPPARSSDRTICVSKRLPIESTVDAPWANLAPGDVRRGRVRIDHCGRRRVCHDGPRTAA